MARVVVLDASFLIALWSDREVHHPWAIDQLGQLAADDLATPALTLAEVLVRPSLAGNAEKLLGNITSLGIAVLDFKADSALALAKTRSSTGLKMPDSLVIHQAMSLGAELATTDKTLIARAVGLEVKVISPWG